MHGQGWLFEPRRVPRRRNRRGTSRCRRTQVHHAGCANGPSGASAKPLGKNMRNDPTMPVRLNQGATWSIYVHLRRLGARVVRPIRQEPGLAILTRATWSGPRAFSTPERMRSGIDCAPVAHVQFGVPCIDSRRAGIRIGVADDGGSVLWVRSEDSEADNPTVHIADRDDTGVRSGELGSLAALAAQLLLTDEAVDGWLARGFPLSWPPDMPAPNRVRNTTCENVRRLTELARGVAAMSRGDWQTAALTLSSYHGWFHEEMSEPEASAFGALVRWVNDTQQNNQIAGVDSHDLLTQAILGAETIETSRALARFVGWSRGCESPELYLELGLILTSRSPRDAVLAFIREVDRRFAAAAGERGAESRAAKSLRIVIARAVCVLAPFANKMKVARQIDVVHGHAAEYCRDPIETHYAQLVRASTHAYPFGPGDGNHAVEELGGYGAPGCGHISGIGFVAAVAREVGFADVHQQLCAAFPMHSG